MAMTLTISDENKIQRLKDQGRSFLKANRVDRALKVYANVLRDFPEDVESLLILGDAYLSTADQVSAALLYQQARQFEPNRRDIGRRIELIQGSLSRSGLSFPVKQPYGKPFPTHPRAISQLIQKLTGQATPVPDHEVSRAGMLLEGLLKSPSPAQAVADHLEEIDDLLPALIALNIRQAQTEGRAELAETLEDVLANLLLDMRSDDDENEDDGKDPDQDNKSIRVLLVGVDSQESPFRRSLLVQALTDNNFDLTLDFYGSEGNGWEQYDVMIAHNPHGSQELVRGVAARAAAKLPVIVDLDMDFELLPDEHPDVPDLGFEKPGARRSYQAVMQLADLICVPTEAFAEKLRQQGFNATAIPESWSQYNFLWLKPSPVRTTLNLGLILTPGQVEDVKHIRRALTRILREFPHTHLVVSGDLESYQLFDSLPDTRRLFLPPANLEDYPFLLAQVDILLVPQLDVPFNQMRSDRRLMEAGVRHIPWIASPTRANSQWEKGGLLAQSQDEWYAQLHRLVHDQELRTSLGNQGYQKALERENQITGRMWCDLIHRSVR